MRLAPLGLIACLILAACGDPLRDMPVLADQDVVDAIGQAEIAGGPPPETIAETAPEVLPEPAEPPRRGLLGFLRRQADSATGAAPEDDPVEPAALPESEAVAAPAPEAAQDAPEPARRGGLLGGLFGGGAASGPDAPDPGDPDYAQVGPGEALPYGEVARLCGAPVSQLGRKTQSYPERGRGWELYDSSPGSTAPRNFWLTGFDDGCARQFTAALVLFGPVESYEQIRFSPAGATLPVSETDDAYDALKSRLCRVGRNQPCGNRIGRMGDAVFVSVYERFGSSPRWKNILLHDGQVVAVDVKTR